MPRRKNKFGQVSQEDAMIWGEEVFLNDGEPFWY